MTVHYINEHKHNFIFVFCALCARLLRHKAALEDATIFYLHICNGTARHPFIRGEKKQLRFDICLMVLISLHSNVVFTFFRFEGLRSPVINLLLVPLSIIRLYLIDKRTKSLFFWSN